MDWISIIKTTGVIAGSLASVWGFIRYIWKPAFRLGKGLNEFYHNVSYTAKEMKPNGGTSMKDTMEGLKQSMENILIAVSKLDQRQVAIANHSEKCIFEANINGDIVFVNRAWCRLTNRSADELLGKGWKLTVHPDDRDKTIEEWNQCVSERRDFVHTYRILRPDHSIVTVDAHAYVLHGMKDQMLGFYGFIVTRRQDNSVTGTYYE